MLFILLLLLPIGTPNKEQNGANKEQSGPNKEHNWEKRTKMRSFRGVFFHKNSFSKFKFISKGAELFWAPPIVKLSLSLNL